MSHPKSTTYWPLLKLGGKCLAAHFLCGWHCPKLSGIMVIYVFFHTCSLPCFSQLLNSFSPGEDKGEAEMRARKQFLFTAAQLNCICPLLHRAIKCYRKCSLDFNFLLVTGCCNHIINLVVEIVIYSKRAKQSQGLATRGPKRLHLPLKKGSVEGASPSLGCVGPDT